MLTEPADALLVIGAGLMAVMILYAFIWSEKSRYDYCLCCNRSLPPLNVPQFLINNPFRICSARGLSSEECYEVFMVRMGLTPPPDTREESP